MKRSEMKNLIRQELLKTVGGDAAKYIAEDILFLIQQAGMLPPRAQVTKRSIMYGDDGDCLFDEWITVPAYEWEPE